MTARFDVAPADVGDAWTSLDAALEPYALVLLRDGGVVLQAPVTGQARAR